MLPRRTQTINDANLSLARDGMFVDNPTIIWLDNQGSKSIVYSIIKDSFRIRIITKKLQRILASLSQELCIRKNYILQRSLKLFLWHNLIFKKYGFFCCFYCIFKKTYLASKHATFFSSMACSIEQDKIKSYKKL